MPHPKVFSHVSRHLHIRQAPASSGTNVTTAEDTTNTYAAGIVRNAQATTTTLAIVVCILAVVIIAGTFVFRLRCKKLKAEKQKAEQQKGSQESGSQEHSSYEDKKLPLYPTAEDDLKKPKAAFAIPHHAAFGDTSTGWTPQIREYRGVAVSGKQYEKNMTSSKARARWEKAILKANPKLKTVSVAHHSPPPSYHVANGGIEPSLPDAAIIVTKAPPAILTLPPTPPMSPGDSNLLATQGGEVPEPLPSPARSASFAYQQLSLPKESKQNSGSSSSSSTSPSNTVRLMTAVNTFIRSLDDELPIHTGDTLRMFEEYQDGWCLCQQVGPANAPKGVVPRFCLVDKQAASPPIAGRSLTGPTALALRV